ncbi:agamous-like MADS-box protein AGL62 [Herrania umbratica]|uniref:Agamous-like MADS-box protein AGL62 n=1 Tax=Herrania umbratica TaxID=108875 RepID=A0A6J0ZJH8_9ROSI|nr:agamous-like MADS-box protein AGL62 [Herrania umbratica]
MAGSSSKGRRRTQMWMIPGADARQVAFSKRRSGLFKKARELCTLCAVETALVVFSPGGKAFSFGHPGVDTIMNRLPNLSKPDLEAIQCTEAEYEASLRELNKEYSDITEKLNAEKLRGERLKQMRMESQSQGQSLVERPVDELNLEELLTLKSMLEEFKVKLRKRMQELSVEAAASTSILAGESDASLGGTTEGNSSADPHDHDVGHAN